MSCTSCSTKDKNKKGCRNNGICQVNGCDKLTIFDWLADIDIPVGLAKYDVVEVQFKNDRKEYFRNVEQLPLQIGDMVVVGEEKDWDVGKVSLTGELVKTQEKIKKVKKSSITPILRKAKQEDLDSWQANREKEEEIKIESRRIANRLALSMKITDIEYQADGRKITFYYTSESRVDFRQLIREYAGAFHTKIDMRQIGYRQETAKIGGIGSCGRELCCSSWLTDFRSVNTSAARYQQLSINPQKLAGQCGKLKCCLNYELDNYLEALDYFPSAKTNLLTEKGKAYCIKIDVFRKKMFFLYEHNSMQWFEFSVDEVKEMIATNKSGKNLPPLEDLVEDNTYNSVDIIEENSLNRFENKNRNKKRGRNKRPNNSKNKPTNSNKKSTINKSNNSNKTKTRSKKNKSQ